MVVRVGVTLAPGSGSPATPSGPRTLVQLPAHELDRYTAVVAAVTGVVEAGLSDAVCANRVAAWSVVPPALHLVPWRDERAAFGRRLAALAATHRYLVFADVRDCYGSISPPIVAASLRALGCTRAATVSVYRVLQGFAASGIRGLPVGPDPSPVLANAVLAAADRALERAGIDHVRWVDDVAAGVADRAAAERLLAVLEAALVPMGLGLNHAKTRVVVDPMDGARGVSMAEWPGSVG